MGVAQVLSRAQLGLEAPLVQIEAHLGSGLPGFSIVGLPTPVVRESRERVRSALLNSGYDFPPGRITVNLAPVELAKEGGRYDLPVALALLVASGQLTVRRHGVLECYGELGLDGQFVITKRSVQPFLCRFRTRVLKRCCSRSICRWSANLLPPSPTSGPSTPPIIKVGEHCTHGRRLVG